MRCNRRSGTGIGAAWRRKRDPGLCWHSASQAAAEDACCVAVIEPSQTVSAQALLAARVRDPPWQGRNISESRSSAKNTTYGGIFYLKLNKILYYYLNKLKMHDSSSFTDFCS
jgi:hypothetical protein